MKISFKQKIASGLIIFSLCFSLFFSFPQKTNALFGVGDITLDPTNLVQNTITATNSTASAIADQSLNFKEYVLDGLASVIAKQIIRQVTSSVVSWINSGFEGSPSFLQNPGSFFLDVADQITGDFLSKNDGPLNGLCSPFSIDIRIALAFKYRPNVAKRYTCTLGTIIKNSGGALQNSSINGFTAGDFKQGGWPAFLSLTTEPQNNIYGAFLQADSELSWRVANAQEQQRSELGAGKGFLSWRDPKCTKDIAKYNEDIKKQRDVVNINADGSESSLVGNRLVQTKLDCPIVTPGKVIADSLQNNIDGPLRELELADEFNEIVNALFAQLATQVLQKGLAGVSSKDSSGQSYLDQTIKDINSEASPQAQNLKAEILKNVETGKKNAIEYKNNRDEALNIMLGIKGSFDAVKACYSLKINANPPILTNSQKLQAQSKVIEIDSIISTNIANKTLNLLDLAKAADTQLKTLQEIQDGATNAKTLNELGVPSQKYSTLLQSGGLVSALDIQKSKADLDDIKDSTSGLKQDALRKMQECQLSI